MIASGKKPMVIISEKGICLKYGSKANPKQAAELVNKRLNS